MQAIIQICGVIGDIGEGTRYTFTNLVSDIKEARDSGATSFQFVIDSDGGLVNEGFLIASYIESLKEPTEAVAVRVYSIANIIYFACDKRTSDTYGMFMLHQAWADFSGNSNDLRSYASLLDKEDDRIASYIASRTGMDFEAVKGLMGTDRFIEKEEADRLGFFNSVQALKIAALYQNKMSMKESVKKALAVLANAVGMGDEPKEEAVNMDITLENGDSIYVESEDGELEGKPTNAPDGTHLLSDGRSITVEGGVVVSVQEATAMEGEEDAEKLALQEQVAELQSKIQEYEASARDMKESEEAQAKAYSALEEKIEFLAKNIGTNKTAPAKHERFNQKAQNGKPEGKKEAPKGFGTLQARLQSGEKMADLIK